jgi:hypothetical protein
MNIIFGDSAKNLPDHYIKLELDTFRTADSDHTVTAYCLVQKLSPDEFVTLDAYKKIHADLMEAYRQQHWNYCEQAVAGLMGRWGGELDTFYTDLLKRAQEYQQTSPGPDWDGTRLKTV